MKLKSLILKTLISSLVLSTPITAMASELNFKVAVIKNSDWSQNMIAGNYDEIIASLSIKNIDKITFEEHTSLCVAYLKSNNAMKSESACTAAVKSANTIDFPYKKATYLQSISYSIRAIARYLQNDTSGAMNDLTSAILLDNNSIVQANLRLVKSNYSQYEGITSSVNAE